ncbi:MAG: NADH:ubiquinone oxidoreductase subunit NDUFA12 [Paracoccaceae bacterium]
MGIARSLLRTVTWWNDQTINTQLFTWRRGVRVGEDGDGNIYYETRDKKRRWVIFDGITEASRVSPEWHGWLHHTFDDPPTTTPMTRKSWEIPHQQNLTGSDGAYAPAGSMRQAAPVARQDYEAWKPE